MAQDNVGKARPEHSAKLHPRRLTPTHHSRRHTCRAILRLPGTTKLHTAIPQARRARTHNIIHITFVHE